MIDYSKAIELDEENPERWHFRGDLYTNYLDDNQKALDDFAKALELDSTYVSAINARGLIFVRKVNMKMR